MADTISEEPRFDEEELKEIARLQSDPTSEHYYNDPDETFMSKVRRKLEPYGEEFKGFVEYLFSPSKHFGTGQYNEGGLAAQMEALEFRSPLGRSPHVEIDPEELRQAYIDTEREVMREITDPEFSGFGYQNLDVSAPTNLATPPLSKAKTPVKNPETFYGYTEEGLQQEVNKFAEEFNEQDQANINKAAEFLVPFYDSGVNISNVVEEYMKPEGERNYDYIKSQFTEAGQNAALEAGLILMGGVVGKYGAKGVKALSDKIKQYEIDPNTTSAFGVGAIKKKAVEPLEIGINAALEDGKFLKNYDASTAADMAGKAKNATAGNTRANALINTAVPEGTRVGIRLNLNSKIPDMPKGLDKLQTVHKGSYNGKALSYLPFATVKNVVFSVSQSGRTGIASKLKGIDTPEAKNKHNAMSVDGEYVPNKNLLDSNEDLVEIGFNPGVHHLFIDLKTGQAVKGAEEATVIGDRVYAKGVEYWKKAEAPAPIPTQSGVDIPSDVRFRFKKGGMAMDDQMGAMFKSSRTGYALGGEVESVDPVSGNEVPVGSFASEVRDDIPAMLSEGEYVVPADVLRYYGLKFFEDLREQAKADLQRMDEDGRIGGEPIEEPMGEEISDEELMAMLSQMQGQTDQMNTGGYVSGYNQAGLVAGNMSNDQLKNFALTPTVPMTPSLVGQYAVPGAITTNTQVGVPSPTGETPQSCAQKGMVYDEVTQQCVPIQPKTPAASQAPAVGGGGNDDGPPTPVESKPWYESVNWADPAETLGNYFGTQGKVGSAVAGVMGSVIGGPALGAAFSQGSNVSNLANARAMVNVYEAMGMTEQAKMIQGQINTQLKNSKVLGIADKAIDAVFGSDGDIKTIQALKAAGIEVDSNLRDEELDEFLEGLKKDTSARDKLRSRYVPKAKPPVTPAKPAPKTEPEPAAPPRSPATAAASLANRASNTNNSSHLAALQRAQKIAQKAADAGTSIAKQTQTGSAGYGTASSSDEATGGKGSVSKGSGWGGMNKGGLMKKKKK